MEEKREQATTKAKLNGTSNTEDLDEESQTMPRRVRFEMGEHGKVVEMNSENPVAVREN